MQLSCDSVLALEKGFADGSIGSGNMRRSLSGDYAVKCMRKQTRKKGFVVSWAWVAVQFQ